jgi:hypothetical protein
MFQPVVPARTPFKKTLYPLIGEPPSYGGVHNTVMKVVPAATLVGTAGCEGTAAARPNMPVDT